MGGWMGGGTSAVKFQGAAFPYFRNATCPLLPFPASALDPYCFLAIHPRQIRCTGRGQMPSFSPGSLS
jgi:hypothetical protein